MAQERRGVWGRVAGGAGSANVAPGDPSTSGVQGVGSGTIGWTLREELLLGAELNMWTKTYEKTSDSQTSANIINLLGTITLFPIPPFNWFVKGGVGMGVRDVDQITGRITVTEDFGKGVALIAGTGVDFSVGRILSWTIEFDYWYGHMGTIHRQNVAFSSAHQRVAVILVGLTFH